MSSSIWLEGRAVGQIVLLKCIYGPTIDPVASKSGIKITHFFSCLVAVLAAANS